MRDLTVLQAKRYGTFSCHNHTKLLDAARRMAEEDISALVVTDDNGYLAGIITRTDLVRAHQARADWATQTVEACMSQPVVTVTPQHKLSHVAKLLIEKRIHRVVVVQDENGKQRPLGVVSSADLVYHMAKEN
jgi:signal-transduction protein with cAMP-binding, CBS, and nucleotidyltransferase domain